MSSAQGPVTETTQQSPDNDSKEETPVSPEPVRARSTTVAVSLTDLLVIIPQTSWSQDLLCISVPKLRIVPKPDAGWLGDTLQAMHDRPIREAEDVFSAFPPAKAEDLETALFRLLARKGRAPDRRPEQTQQIPPFPDLPKHEVATGTTAFVLEDPELYWMQCKPGAVISREFAEGSSMLVVLETAAAAATGVAVTIHWPWQNVLAGEAQFSQIMRTLFGNVSELGFDVPPPVCQLAVGESQPQARPLPSSLRLPETEGISYVVNIALQQTFFCVEALHRPECGDSAGCGKQLAHVHLTNSKVQVRMTTGTSMVHCLGTHSVWVGLASGGEQLPILPGPDKFALLSDMLLMHSPFSFVSLVPLPKGWGHIQALLFGLRAFLCSAKVRTWIL
jgi:hypothetical protein